MAQRLSPRAVDLADGGTIDPFEGFERLFATICVHAWLGWHVSCFLWGRAYPKERIAQLGDLATLRKALESD